ncbi:MAG: hypothetical protein NT079_00735, partial [Candidatus Omnitrophica bacterium]|nr:hypothetical protein [Candidatus Omnitrophota bacterium]
MQINNNRGIALIIVYGAIMVLALLSTAFLINATTESRAAVSYANSLRAFWAAEAGIQKASWEVHSNSCAGCTTCSSNKCIT